jgi:hypothetical protein
MNVAFLRLESLPDDQCYDHDCGVILPLVVDDLDEEFVRLEAEGVILHANRVIVQPIDWKAIVSRSSFGLCTGSR